MSPLQFKYLHKLAGHRVLIFGGTSGIGFAVAEAALEHGATVILSSSKPARVENAIQRLKDAYPDPNFHARITGYPCDLSIAEKLEENLHPLFNQATENRTALLDHIVFTAGNWVKFSTLEDLSLEYIRNVGNVRYLAPLIIAKLARSYMKVVDTSSITLTSSGTHFRPPLQWTAICGFLAGLEGVTRSLAVELAPIRVNTVYPGSIKTELFDGWPQDKLPELMDKWASQNLLNKIGRPEEVAEAYVYAMKDSFATGTMITSDGGKRIK